VKRFETGLLDFIRTRHADLLNNIRNTGAMPEGDTMATAGRRLQGPVRPHCRGAERREGT